MILGEVLGRAKNRQTFSRPGGEKLNKLGTTWGVENDEFRRLSETVPKITTTDSRYAAFAAANAAESKKASATLILDVRTVTILADYFVISGGQTSTQVRAIADAIEECLEKLGYKAKSIEGKKEGRWVLMDFENIIVHILQEKERSYYKLEQFWNHALIVPRHDWIEDEEQAGHQET